MTPKIETQYQHLERPRLELPEPIPQRSTGPSGGGRRGHAWSRSVYTRGIRQGISGALEAVLEGLDYVQRIGCSSSKRGTARPPGSAPEVSSTERRNEFPDRQGLRKAPRIKGCANFPTCQWRVCSHRPCAQRIPDQKPSDADEGYADDDRNAVAQESGINSV
jgi:hypothetical protein